MIGETFGGLTVIGDAGYVLRPGRKRRSRMYRVRCVCGVIEERSKRFLMRARNDGSTPRCRRCFREALSGIDPQVEGRNAVISGEREAYRVLYEKTVAELHEARKALNALRG